MSGTVSVTMLHLSGPHDGSPQGLYGVFGANLSVMTACNLKPFCPDEYCQVYQLQAYLSLNGT